MRIEDAIVDRMSRFLDFAARKQQVNTSNLANTETPGYVAKDLRFQDVLEEAKQGTTESLRKTHPEHLGGRPVLIRDEITKTRAQDSLGHDRNNVDLEKELVDLSENVLKFSVVGRLLQLKLQQIRSGIKEGRS
jgi:flagellar basal-body rod protein FlgB